MASLPPITVLTLGGTIASSADPGAGATIKVSGAELLRGLPEASAVGEVSVRSVRLVPSADLRLADDQIHAARHVRKGHTSATSAFSSPLSGPVGYLTENRVRMLTRPAGRLSIACSVVPDDCRVAQLVTYFDDDGALIRAVPPLGYRGLVMSAFGGGHVPSWIAPVLGEISEQIPVVLASRTNGGEVLRSTYAYPGAEMDLLARGLIPAAGLDAAHATVLLRLLLGAGVPCDALAWCFEQAVTATGLVAAPVQRPGRSCPPIRKPREV
jgi:L-asparaginase